MVRMVKDPQISHPTAALAALLDKRFKLYYGRAGGHWALREGMKRWRLG